MAAASVLQVCSLVRSLMPYAPMLALQEELVALRKQDRLRDTLLLLQHPPTYTVGKRGSAADFLVPQEELQRRGAHIVHIPRGGETTFHGPGQLVAYPIVDIRQLKVGARAYVEGLEDAMIRTLGCFGLQARGRVPGRTGVWVGERKIGAVGVRITHGITSHGIALNVNTDLSHFDAIVPCGTPDKEVTSIACELAMPRGSSSEAKCVGVPISAVNVGLVARLFLEAFSRQYSFQSVESVGLDHVATSSNSEALAAAVRLVIAGQLKHQQQ